MIQSPPRYRRLRSPQARRVQDRNGQRQFWFLVLSGWLVALLGWFLFGMRVLYCG